jgi:ATP-dependent Clp protease ATP-binding subunit ClpA
MSLWEPFSEPARESIVRAQQVAQMFSSTFIGTEHMAFALAERDDDVGHLFANSLDRQAIREQLGGVISAPVDEMIFTDGAKNAIEKAFVNARRLKHSYIDVPHVALGLLDSSDPPPLLPDRDAGQLHRELEEVARSGDRPHGGWKQLSGSAHPHTATNAILTTLFYFPDLRVPGTRVTVTIAPPDAEERTWSWERHEDES